MKISLAGLYGLASKSWTDFYNLDFSQINYSAPNLAKIAGALLLVVLVLRIIFGRNKPSHEYSGHFISDQDKRGVFAKTFYLIPKLLLAAGSVFLILALADPYLLSAGEKSEYLDSRERVELLDVSTSMGWPYQASDKSVGEVIREEHLRFLKMRQGKNDRVAFWIFAENAYKIEDFTMDNELYRFQVFDTPYVITSSLNPALPKNDTMDKYIDLVAPALRVKLIDNEGSTNLEAGLLATIKYFNQAGDRNIANRSLLIISDAAVENYPEYALSQLKINHITPYLLHVKPNRVGEEQFGLTQSVEYAQQLEDYIVGAGGKVYDVDDRDSARRAFEDFDRTQTVKIKIVHKFNSVKLFPIFIQIGVLFVIAGIFFGLLAKLVWGVYP